MHPKEVGGMAKSVDPDETARAVKSGSALFALEFINMKYGNY